MRNVTSILGLIALGFIQSAWAGDEIALAPKQFRALGISVAPLPTRHTGEIAGLPAQVVIPANQVRVVGTPLPAMVEQVLVGVGDSVTKGQPLAHLQSPALAEAQRGLLQAAVQQQLAGENLARDEALWKDGIISESRYRATRGQALEAQAALSERRQQLRLAGMPDTAIAKLQSGKALGSLLTLTAPLDGVVLEKSVIAGQRLDAAVPVFTIGRLDTLALEIQAPLAQTGGLHIGATVEVPAHGASGTLTAIGRSLSGGNQTVLLRATIRQGAESLRPGQYVEANIVTGSGELEQWSIPNAAISRIAGRTVVFVQTPQGFRAQDVRVIREGAKDSLIGGAFKGNEKIAVNGVSSLKSGLMGIGGGE